MIQNKHFSAFALSAFFLTACATTSSQTSVSTPEKSTTATPLVGAYQAHTFTLSNGLRLIVVEDHSSPTFAYQTWFKVGSREEKKDYTGLAHLFEHMMFKQTKNLKEGEFDKTLEAAGVEDENAFTSRDYTAYVQELPKNKLELIASLEAERMVNLVVDDQAFRTEAEVVQNERRYRTENSPDGLMDQELFGLAFTRHPYRWPVIGYQEDLDRMTAKEAVEFYRSFYSPNRATIVVCGDVKPQEVHAVIKKHYETIPSQPSPAYSIEQEPAQTSARHKTLKLNIKTEKLLMGYRTPDVMSDDVPALNLLQAVLAYGKSSRLQRALIETGIASLVEAYQHDDRDPSLFVIGVNLQKGKRAAHAEAIIMKEIARLAQQPISNEELEKAKNQFSTEFYKMLEGNAGKARLIGAYEALTGDFSRGVSTFQKSLKISAADIQAIAKRYFNPVNRSAITGIPK